MASRIRVELTTESPEMQDGLQARIHDPLWMLARQWQFGEFKGEDAGSPAAAQVVVESASLSRYQAGAPSAPDGARPYSPTALALETLVEAEPIVADERPNFRLSAEAGLQLGRHLRTEGVGQHRSLFLRSNYVLEPPTAEQRAALDGDSLRFLQVVGNRVVDGVRLHARLAALRARNALPEFFQESPFDTIAAGDRPAVVRAITAWLDWYDSLLHQGETRPAWIPERIEYEFAVSARTSDGEVVLAAPEYLEGRLDWFSFVVRPGASLGADGPVSSESKAFLPAPVTFRGMPSPRFWEFEDGKVNFAQVDADPHDLVRLLLVKFVLEYSNDWFAVPVEVAAGSLCQVRSLVITDTFGERLLIPHASQVDGPESPWRMFTLSQDAQHLFFLPPALGPGLQSPPVEEVLFLRDEMANVAWGIERVVESAAGRPLDRYEAFQENRARRERQGESSGGGGQLAYRLGTRVPDYWIPLLPVQEGTSVRLKRGALPDLGSDGVTGILEPQGRVLEPGRELLLHDEEVPREGARVTRAYQYARWIDGSTRLWIGRRKQPGRGEGSSGLRFDIAEPPTS